MGLKCHPLSKTEKKRSEGEGEHSKKNLGRPGLGKEGNAPQMTEKNQRGEPWLVLCPSAMSLKDDEGQDSL